MKIPSARLMRASPLTFPRRKSTSGTTLTRNGCRSGGGLPPMKFTWQVIGTPDPRRPSAKRTRVRAFGLASSRTLYRARAMTAVPFAGGGRVGGGGAVWVEEAHGEVAVSGLVRDLLGEEEDVLRPERVEGGARRGDLQ